MKKVLFVCDLRNFLAQNWIQSFQQCGCEVQVFCLDWSLNFKNNEGSIDLFQNGVKVLETPFTSSGFSSTLKLFQKTSPLSDTLKNKVISFDPDLIVSWWGITPFEALKSLKETLPQIPVVSIVGTFPNAYSELTWQMEKLIWSNKVKMLSGLIFYSSQMKELFHREVKGSKNIRYEVIIEPQLLSSFCSSEIDHGKSFLNRQDDSAHVVFTGTTKWLFDKRSGMRKDAMGHFLKGLSEQELHVYIQDNKHIEPTDYLHFLPKGLKIHDGELATYLSDFDAHLVVYNEFNRITKRRVSSGLGTRFAYGQTFPSPMMVSNESKFAHEEINKYNHGLIFEDFTDLVRKLKDLRLLRELKSSYNENIERLSFEARYKDSLSAFVSSFKS